MLTLSRRGGSAVPSQPGPVLGSVFRRRRVILYGIGAACLVAAAIISARYFVVGEWESMEALGAARPAMIGMLDRFRHCLDDLGNGLGVTDPISGDSVLTLE